MTIEFPGIMLDERSLDIRRKVDHAYLMRDEAERVANGFVCDEARRDVNVQIEQMDKFIAQAEALIIIL